MSLGESSEQEVIARLKKAEADLLAAKAEIAKLKAASTSSMPSWLGWLVFVAFILAMCSDTYVRRWP